MSVPLKMQGWSQEAIDKARMFELMKHFVALASIHYPDLLRYALPCIKRLSPLRLSPGGRQLRAWGRSYYFDGDDSFHIRRLVQAFRNGTPRIHIGKCNFEQHPVVKEGIVQSNGIDYWIEEPADEKAKPKLVLYVDAQPEDVLSLEGRAIAILAEHPEWTKTKIAAEVPCSRAALYTFPMFMAACEMQEKGREKYQRDNSGAGD